MVAGSAVVAVVVVVVVVVVVLIPSSLTSLSPVHLWIPTCHSQSAFLLQSTPEAVGQEAGCGWCQDRKDDQTGD